MLPKLSWLKQHVPTRQLLKFFLLFTIVTFHYSTLEGQELFQQKQSRRRVNIMVANTVDAFDLYSKTLYIRAKIRSVFSLGRFRVINACCSYEVYEKVRALLQHRKAKIGTLWFDSHGHFEEGHSSFRIGHELFNYSTVRNAAATEYLQRLSAFCDHQTKVLIGSCYSGATFFRSYKDSLQTYMYGDSLMIGLSHILGGTIVYGSESWVMMKPGFFQEGYALAGYPLGKKTMDIIFKPVWYRMGQWNQYLPGTTGITPINTVGLNGRGEAVINEYTYQTERIRRKIHKKVARLKPGLWKPKQHP